MGPFVGSSEVGSGALSWVYNLIGIIVATLISRSFRTTTVLRILGQQYL